MDFQGYFKTTQGRYKYRWGTWKHVFLLHKFVLGNGTLSSLLRVMLFGNEEERLKNL